jgi:hypothetical protein
MEPEVSLPCSQEHSTSPYPEPDQSSPPTPSYFPKKKTLWPESASELYRPSNRRLSTKLVPTFAEKGRHVASVTDPYGRIIGCP